MYKSRRVDQPADVFVQPPDGAVKVWRYMDLGKLIYTLDRRVLVMPRLDRLRDPYEGAPTHFDRAELTQAMKEFNAPPEAEAAIRNLGENVPKTMRKTMFASSWHMNEAESDAMWRLYCGKEPRRGTALNLRET